MKNKGVVIIILNLLEDCKGNYFSNPKMFLFETNSLNFKINYEIMNTIKANSPNLGITARSGICVLYYSPAEENWFNVDVYVNKSQINVLMSHMINEGDTYKVLIYGPILSNLNKLTVEINDNFYSKIIDNWFVDELSFFGGISTFGIGCTTVGTMFSNILSRKLGLKTNNISFNQRNYLKSVYNFLIDHIKDIPHSEFIILELDYYNQDDEIVKKYLKYIVKFLKMKCDFLIGWITIPPNKSYKIDNIYELLHDEINNKDIIIEDLSFLYDEKYYEMCTFGFNFINDTGNIFIFKNLKETMEELKNGVYKFNK